MPESEHTTYEGIIHLGLGGWGLQSGEEVVCIRAWGRRAHKLFKELLMLADDDLAMHVVSQFTSMKLKVELGGGERYGLTVCPGRRVRFSVSSKRDTTHGGCGGHRADGGWSGWRKGWVRTGEEKHTG